MSVSGTMAAVGISRETLNRVRDEVYAELAGIIARRHALGVDHLHGLAEEFRDGRLRDILGTGLMRAHADIAAPAKIEPSEQPTAPHATLPRRPTR